jgi:hypothetical protein
MGDGRPLMPGMGIGAAVSVARLGLCQQLFGSVMVRLVVVRGNPDASFREPQPSRPDVDISRPQMAVCGPDVAKALDIWPSAAPSR